MILPLFPKVDGVSNPRVPGGVVHELPGDLRNPVAVCPATALDSGNLM